MINEKSEIHKKRKNLGFSILIVLISVILITILIGFKIEPIRNLIDNNRATRDIVVDDDYYDTYATTIKAEKAKSSVENIVLKLNEQTYSAFDDLIKFFNSTDTYRTRMSLAFQSDYNTEEDRQKIIDNYVSYAGNIGIEIKKEEAITLLSEISLLEYENFKTSYKLLFTNKQSSEINQENIYEDIVELNNDIKKVISNKNILLLSNQITNKFLRANSIVDLEATKLLKQNTYNNVINNFPVVIKKDTKIITKGEIVSEEILRILGDMNLLNSNFNLSLFIGIFILLMLLLLPIVAYKKMIIKNYKITPKQLIMINLVVIMLFALAYFVPKEFYYLLPVIAVPMMLSMLTNYKIAIIITMPLAVLLSIMKGGDISYMTMIMVSGVLSVYLVKNTKNRLKFAATGVIIGFLNAVILLVISIVTNIQVQSILNNYIFIIVSGVISAIISLGILPIFESLFNIITPFKLLELSNPGQPLINRLLIEAPGTYHHSLMVGNLSEAGAEAIGANGLLARVGAYYHDIGKLKRPEFFTENQEGKNNPHDKMTPSLSTFVIVNHTKDGRELAKKHKLPIVIRNIIEEHHGTSIIQYFYHKARQKDDAVVKEKDYRYPGPRPTTKESAVVMLADTVEASVRSMNNATTSLGEIEGFIRKQIKDKIEEGQLALVDLTFKDIDDISDAFTRVFSGYFHQRIQYPEKQEVNNDEIQN